MIHVWGMTDIGLVRNENQDTYMVSENEATGHVVAVVCDGMGGAEGGQLASQLAAKTFVDACAANLHKGLSLHQVRQVAEFAISEANRTVYEESQKKPELRGMGTTLVSAIIDEGQALVCNIGDSRAYLVHPRAGEDSISHISRDHSLVQRMVEKGDITPEEARSHPSRNLITRALGPEPNTLSDSYEVKLDSGDAILLCTDGLIETVTDQEMAREIQYGADNTCMDRLLDIAKSRGAADNVTAVLLRQV